MPRKSSVRSSEWSDLICVSFKEISHIQFNERSVESIDLCLAVSHIPIGNVHKVICQIINNCLEIPTIDRRQNMFDCYLSSNITIICIELL